AINGRDARAPARDRSRRTPAGRRVPPLASRPRLAERSRLSLPARLGTPRRAAYAPCVAGKRVLGRARELARIEAFVAGADQGFAALAIVGEAGIGKTTLWEEAVRTAEARAYTVLRCRAAEQEVTLAYACLGDLFGDSDALLPHLPG